MLTQGQSVFGIQTFTIRVEDWRFLATMLGVCIPFFVLILVLQTRPAMEAVKKWGRAVAGAGRWALTLGGAKGQPVSAAGEQGKGGRRFHPLGGLKRRVGSGGVGSGTGAGGGGGGGVKRSPSVVGGAAWRRVREWTKRGRRREVSEGVGGSGGKEMVRVEEGMV